MDEDGLPIVGTGIDFTKVKPLDKKQLLAFINHFVTHTARFLNNFSGVCEEKMIQMESQLQRLEVTMNILEAKLSSIPGLDDVKAATPPSQLAPSQAENTASSAPAPPPPPPPGATASPAAPPPAHVDETPLPPPAAEPEPNFVKVSQDERYMRFFKMAAVGVPAPAVKMKMAAEGLNPDLLDTPDAPAPPAGATSAGSKAADSSESDAEFTDSD